MIDDVAEWKSKLGKRLSELRNAKGLKPGTAARIAKIERRHFDGIETGVNAIRLHEAMELAELYGVTINDICGDEKKPEDGDIIAAVAALRTFSPELRQHYRFVLRAVQIRSEDDRAQVKADPWQKVV